MDDEEIRSAMRVLTEPRPAPPGAHEQITRRVTARRRRRRGGLAAAVVLICVVAVGATIGFPGQPPIGPVASRMDSTVPIKAGGWPWGFTAEMTVGFPDNRNMLSGRFVLDGRAYPVSFYPNDGTDNDVQPDPLPLAAGVSVTSSARLAPDCAAAARAPTLYLRSRLDDGTVTTDRFTVSNPELYATALAAWCSKSAQVTVEGATSNPAGDVKVTLRIVNPGPDLVTVTSDAYDIGRSHWNAGSVAVPPAGTQSLVLTATHSSCGLHTPWTEGHLKANGKPIEIADGTGC